MTLNTGVPPLEKLRALSRFLPFGPVAKEDIEVLEAMAGPVRSLAKGATIRAIGEPVSTLDLLVKGWAASAIVLQDGTRQLVSINLPGDVLGLPALSLAEPIDDVVALGPVTVRSIPLSGLTRLFEEHPRLAGTLFLISQEERMLAMERIALMGQALAKTRLAGLFVRLNERVGQFDDNWSNCFDLPLTQRDMADLIGVTTVHLNNVVQELRGDGIIQLSRSELRILDLDRLLALAALSPWRQAKPAWLPG